MPISVDAFERGGERYSVEERIVEFLRENDQQAYNVREITEAVMETGWSETNVERELDGEFDDELDSQPDDGLDGELLGCIVDLATVSSILDRLVDHGALERRVVDAGEGERSYYRTRAR
ncbi:hypothetical protein [Halorussus litoreus]|uniref:hypothetical protein n=1 Tax=Halorussus litoreus TaxID=1710536 RepID=UPI000E27AD98|nr:hypothetical protein [Halorussus litoreus]